MRTKLEGHGEDSHIYGIRVFREDIEEIIDTLKFHDYTVKIEFDGFAYENIDELKDYCDVHLNKIKLSAKKNDGNSKSLSVNFDRGTVYLYSLFETDTAYFKVRDILESKSSFLGRSLYYWIIPVGIALGGYYIVGKYTIQTIPAAKLSQNIPLTNAIVLWTLILLALISFIVGFFRHSFLGVWLSKRHEGGFWRRNKDQILLILIGSAITLLVTKFIPWILKK